VPYTLAMFLLWGVLMALVGIVIGWLLCRVRMRTRRSDRTGARSHGGRGPTDDATGGPAE
jgi:hypothetical protein